MRSRKRSREALLEVGMAASLAFVLAAFGMILLGGIAGRAQRLLRRRRPVPEPGSIPPERHQQVAVTSPR